jgi:(p)ppGpp synthase/HD superfamily hydrolase
VRFIEAVEQARHAHYGQVDKAGRPYIEHVLRVAFAVRFQGEDAMVVAVLHDVLEDTDYEPTGLTPEQAVALDAITRREGEKYRDYVTRCGKNLTARRVKLADLNDNMTADRMAALPAREQKSLAKRYRDALRTLVALDTVGAIGGAGWPE